MESPSLVFLPGPPSTRLRQRPPLPLLLRASVVGVVGRAGRVLDEGPAARRRAVGGDQRDG